MGDPLVVYADYMLLTLDHGGSPPVASLFQGRIENWRLTLLAPVNVRFCILVEVWGS